MRKYAVAVLIVSLFALLGFAFISTYFQPVDSLIRPPQAEGENLAIQLAFSEAAGDDFILKQPLNGNYRNAYTFIDLTGDNNDEVIVFYSKSNDLGIVRMNVLDKKDDEWVSIADFQSAHSDIHEIEFADLNGDNTKEIIVGWTVLGESYSKLITVYQIADSENNINIKPVYKDYYSSFRISDIDCDSCEDILSLKYATAGNASEYSASLISYDNGEICVRGSFTIDNSISSVAAINFDYIENEDTKRVFVDGHKVDGGMITDCFTWNDSVNNFTRYEVSGIGVSSLSYRSSSVLCKDVNSDGIIEVPTEEYLPNISADNQVNADSRTSINLGTSLIKWVKLQRNSTGTVEQHIIMSQYGYSFKFSKDWLGKVSVINDQQKGILTFWSTDIVDGVPQKGKKLFSIMTITEIDLDTIGEISFTYSQLTQLKGKLYYSKIYDAGVKFGITKKEIKNRIIAG